MNIRDVAGESLIPAIEGEFLELSGWWKDLAESDLQRCDVCNQIDLDDVSRPRSGLDGISRGLEHHKSWVELKASAVAGCHLCKLFYFAKLETDKQSRRPYNASSIGQLYVRRSSSTLTIGTNLIDVIRFKICTDKDWPKDDNNRDGGDNALPFRLVEDDPASEEAFARAQRWIEYCKANHPNCLLNEDVPLPTRVLDIYTSTSTEVVSLFISNSQRSKYTALSHCWGDSSRINDQIIRTCTADVFEELKSGISVSRLPRTFQDAITVTRNLGIQYLWIDSLCVKQDSREDWSRESARMSDVYGNSFLTILASTASNSEQGFLGHRDPQRCIMTKFCHHPKSPEHWTWIRWPPTEGKFDRKIRHRAWAFQEYALPPRVLEYAPKEMEWHCYKIMYEESITHLEQFTMHDTYKEMMWILGLSDITKPLPNNQVPTHLEFADCSDNLSIYNRWYTLVEGYSARKLTFETDRLPAIAGIARKIQDISGDIYMAGLWKKDLGAGLCWRVRGFGDLRCPSNYRAPSWSWAALEGSITHSIPEGHKLSAKLLDFDITTDEYNPLGEVLSGSIILSGLLRNLRIAQGTVSIEDIELDYAVNHWTKQLISDGKQSKRRLDYLYALRDQQDVTDPRGTGMCVIYFDLDAPAGVEEVVLLQLLAEGFEPLPKEENEEFEPHGIVLEKMTNDGTFYRRIGAYSVVDAGAPFITTGTEHAGLRGWTESAIAII